MLRSIQALQEMGVSLRMPLSESLQAFLRNYLYMEKAVNIMDDFDKYLSEQMTEPEFQKNGNVVNWNIN